MRMEFVPGATSITFGGMDITPMIDTGKPIVMHYVDPDPPMPEHGFLFVRGMLAPVRFIGRTISLTPAGYRMLLGRSHPRIRRMHSAYSRKRGRGRW